MKDQDIEALRSFARVVLYGGKTECVHTGVVSIWDGAFTDGRVWRGGDLQNLAEALGIVEDVEVTEPCGEECRCHYLFDPEEEGGSVFCCRATEILTGKPTAP